VGLAGRHILGATIFSPDAGMRKVVVKSWHLIAGPAEQESDAAVERTSSGREKSSAFHGALLRQLSISAVLLD
jgi:hypothetical protein